MFVGRHALPSCTVWIFVTQQDSSSYETPTPGASVTGETSVGRQFSVERCVRNGTSVTSSSTLRIRIERRYAPFFCWPRVSPVPSTSCSQHAARYHGSVSFRKPKLRSVKPAPTILNFMIVKGKNLSWDKARGRGLFISSEFLVSWCQQCFSVGVW